MPSESRNQPEQELSIKARSHELYFQPQQHEATKPFPVYLRETPAVPLSTFTKVVLWIVGIIVALLFAAALWRAAFGHGPRRQTRAPRPAARSVMLHTPADPPARGSRPSGVCGLNPPRRLGLIRYRGPSSVEQPAAWLRDRTTQLLRRFDPLVNDDFDIGNSLLIRGTVRRTSRQLRNFGDEGPIGVAPIQDDLVPDVSHHYLSPSRSRLLRHCAYFPSWVFPFRTPGRARRS